MTEIFITHIIEVKITLHVKMILERGQGLRHENCVLKILKQKGPLRQKDLVDCWIENAKDDEADFDLKKHGITRQGMRDILNRLLDKKFIQREKLLYSINKSGLREISFQGFVFGDDATKTLFGSSFARPDNLLDFSERIGALITYVMLQAIKPSKNFSEKNSKEWIEQSISTRHLFEVFKEFIHFNNPVEDSSGDKILMKIPLDPQSFEKNILEFKEYFPDYYSELEKIKIKLSSSQKLFEKKLENPKTKKFPHDDCENKILSAYSFEFHTEKIIWRCHQCGYTIKEIPPI